ncbi:MAG TPA: hypothetical protein VHQ39_07040 [Dongiaceae bacterium]|nr:hypothetical protein [Dongiaceae bacterium]
MKKLAAAKRPPRKLNIPASIVIHDLAQAIAALKGAASAKMPVTLWSAEGAGIYAGAGWFAGVERQARAAVPDARASFVLDCAERADMTQEAFRAGIKAACFSGPAGVATKLADIARQQRALLHRKRPKALDLLNVAEPESACRGYLMGVGAGD